MVSIDSKIGIVILAAGGSTRLGSPKQLLEDTEGITLIRRMNQLAHSSTCDKVITVLGAKHEIIRKEIEDLDGEILINEEWSSGIASSIKLSIKRISQDHPELEALLFLVCDQPFVNKILIDSIIKEYSQSGKPIVASHYQNILGTPALFDRKIFPELLKLEGDRGAGKVIQLDIERVATVAFEEGLFDIDTPSDYEIYLK